jgi:hypothetical protein
MELKYKIVNSRGIPLSSFHSNGGWQIKDVFPCSSKNYISFRTEEEAKGKLSRIIEQCKEQEVRWKEWTPIALKFALSLKVAKDF